MFKKKSFRSPKILSDSSYTVRTGVLERRWTNSSSDCAGQTNGVAISLPRFWFSLQPSLQTNDPFWPSDLGFNGAADQRPPLFPFSGLLMFCYG